MEKEKIEELEYLTKQFFEKNFKDWNLKGKYPYEEYYQNLPYNLNNDIWLAKMLLKIEKPRDIFFNETYEFVRFNRFFKEAKHNFTLSIVEYQIKGMEYNYGFCIDKDYNFETKHSEEKFRKAIIKSLKKLGLKRSLIEEGLEKYNYLWQDKYMEKSYNNNPKHHYYNIDDIEKSNKEEWLNKRKQKYYLKHQKSIEKYSNNPKYNYHEIPFNKEETINTMNNILHKYKNNQILVKEEKEYFLEYLDFFKKSRPFKFASIFFELIVCLLLVLCNLFIYNTFLATDIISKLIFYFSLILSNSFILFGASKIRDKIIQKNADKIKYDLECQLKSLNKQNKIENVSQEEQKDKNSQEEKKEKVSQEEVDTFIIYIGRLYDIIKKNGVDNFKEEIQSLHDLANYYMDAKKNLNTTSEISVFYKCPDLWSRFNDIEDKVKQKIKCSSDIKANEEYLSSLNMFSDVAVLERRKEDGKYE